VFWGWDHVIIKVIWHKTTRGTRGVLGVGWTKKGEAKNLRLVSCHPYFFHAPGFFFFFSPSST